MDNPGATVEIMPTLSTGSVEELRAALASTKWGLPSQKAAIILLHPAMETEPTDVDADIVSALLDDALDAARRTLSQAERNTDGLRAARLDLETTRDIVVASNELAANRAGAA